MNKQTEQFYNEISGRYTDSIARLVPHYDEMLELIFEYLPQDISPITVLELGCGTGNLTSMIAERFPKAQIKAVDISAENIRLCKERKISSRVEYIKSDFRSLDILRESVSLIISSISIHHLANREKEKLFYATYSWLKPKGILTFSDQFRGATEFLYQKHILKWKEFALTNGISPEEWDIWMKHQDEQDFHAPLLDHVQWLKAAGFKTVDCTWRNLLWSILQAHKK